MSAQLEPGFLVAWVRAELAQAGEEPLFDSLCARAQEDGPLEFLRSPEGAAMFGKYGFVVPGG